jgi:hypothetical protein
MSDFFGKLKSSAGKLAFEADKMSKLSQAKSDLEKAKSLVQLQYAKLGELYFTQRGTAGVTGPGYDEICQSIMDLQQQVEAKNDEVQRINTEIYSPQVTQPASQPASTPAVSSSAPAPVQSNAPAAPAAAAATTKFCPNCGHEMPVQTKFCPNCGTKV